MHMFLFTRSFFKGLHMTANAFKQSVLSFDASYERCARRGMVASHSVPGGTGLGGNTVGYLLQENGQKLSEMVCMVIELLDTQAGHWQFSLNGGQEWRTIRTDLINRPGCIGLALDQHARLRVLPFTGHRSQGARLAFHTVHRRLDSGSYCPYADAEDRENTSKTVTLVVTLNAINGKPPEVKVPRPPNKRRVLQVDVA